VQNYKKNQELMVKYGKIHYFCTEIKEQSKKWERKRIRKAGKKAFPLICQRR
jgi:hypothetical protein